MSQLILTSEQAAERDIWMTCPDCGSSSCCSGNQHYNDPLTLTFPVDPQPVIEPGEPGNQCCRWDGFQYASIPDAHAAMLARWWTEKMGNIATPNAKYYARSMLDQPVPGPVQLVRETIKHGTAMDADWEIGPATLIRAWVEQGREFLDKGDDPSGPFVIHAEIGEKE